MEFFFSGCVSWCVCVCASACVNTSNTKIGMADGGEEAAARVSSPEHLEEYHRLIELGLDTRVARKLEEIYRTGVTQSITKPTAVVTQCCSVCSSGKLVHSELDDRALDALKEFPVDGAQSVLQQFLESNLEHVSNKSAFLCGIMKTYRLVR